MAKGQTKRKLAGKYGVTLKEVVPITDNQSKVFRAYDNGQNLMLHGIAGTGKTFISCYLALENLLEKHNQFKKIIIVRSAVPTREIGFLPGDKATKLMEYEHPYQDIFAEICGQGNAYGVLKDRKAVEFSCTSHMRGITLNNAIIIVDEMNNLNFHELDTIMTRIGTNCRVIFCGDYLQSDLRNRNERDGLLRFMEIVEKMKSFEFVEFEVEDIVRSKLVKEYIIAKNS